MRFPTRDTAVVFLRHYLVLGLAWTVIYGGVNYLTSLRSDLHRLYFAWELQIPFVPGFIYVYLSIVLVLVLPLFSLEKRQLDALARSFLAATVVAGLVYLVLPAQLAVTRPETVPGHQFAFGLLYRLALPHNLFPSLHITYATLVLGVIAQAEQSRLVRLLLMLWLLLLYASVLLVRQHQVADIPAGMALAALSYGFVYRRSLRRSRQAPPV